MIVAKSAKVGDPVKASVFSSVTLPNGMKISRGAVVTGQVRAVDANSIAISFDEIEAGGKMTPLSLSIRAAMMPNESGKPSQDTMGQTGAVIGMPGVTLQVDDSPQHASKFESSSSNKFQLKKGLQLMLGVSK